MEIDHSTSTPCLADGCPPTADATLAAPTTDATTDAPAAPTADATLAAPTADDILTSVTPKRASSRIARQQEQKAAKHQQQQHEEAEAAATPSEKGGKGKGKGKRAVAAGGGGGGSGGSGGGGKKKAGAGGATTCRLMGLSSLPRANLLLFKAEVLLLLDPVDLVRLTGVCKRYRALFSTDDVWGGWLGKIDEGRLLKEVEDGNLTTNPYTTPVPKTAKDVFMAATAGKCKGCGAWTAHINLLTLEQSCWPCFEEWRKTGQAIGKSKAMEQYLLNNKEIKSLPHVTSGDPSFMFGSSTIVCRAHVEALIAEKYEDGLEGLEEDRAERKRKAEKNRATVLANWEARRKKAEKEGKRLPKRPKEPKVLHSSVNVNDVGHFDFFITSIFAWTGFVKKLEPHKPRSRDLQTTRHALLCKWCSEANKNTSFHKKALFPSSRDLDSHFPDCPHFPFRYEPR